MRRIPAVIRLTTFTALALGAAAAGSAGAQATAKPAPAKAAPAKAAAATMESGMKVSMAKSLAWSPLEVPGFDPGTMMAVVSGDPKGTGPYTLRLKFPAGYNFPAHWHPNPENVTVLSGTFTLAMGDTRDDTRLHRYHAGDYLWIDAKHPHFGGAIGETVVQLHGTGPFAIELAKSK